MNSPHFFLTSEITSNGLLALHLQTADLPEHFLGTAFHLVIKGGDWRLGGSQLEGPWKSQSQNLFTLTSSKSGPDGQEIIFGLSVKGDAQLLPETLNNGTVVTFFIQGTPGSYVTSFRDAVVSVNVDGQREDLPNAVFEGAAFAIQKSKIVAGQTIFDMKQANEQQFLTQESAFSQELFTAPKALSASILSAQDPYESVFQVYWVTIYFALILLLGVLLAFICHKLLQRKR